MAKTKIYFWLKVDKKFFDNIFIKRLKNMAGGYTMTVIYIRLMLESLESDCILYYEGYFENLAEELALKLDVSEDDINMTLAYFTKCGLVQIDTEGNAELPQAKAMIQQETDQAAYIREYRKNKRLESAKSYNVNPKSNNVEKCKTEIEIEKDIKLDIEQQLQLEKAAGSVGNPIFEKLKEAFGEMSISGTIAEEVEELLRVHGEALLMHALNETILNGGRSIRYTRSILERWQGQGLRTVEQVEQNKQAYKNKQYKTDGIPFDQLGRAEDLGF
ncbi:phage replisome organizer N-terminal domain-containing protein [Streptococcus pneumoniae]